MGRENQRKYVQSFAFFDGAERGEMCSPAQTSFSRSKHGPLDTLETKCISGLDPPIQKGGGHAQPDILLVDTSGPIVKIGALQSIQDIIAKNFLAMISWMESSVQASLGHVGQSLHEDYNLEPPSTLPWDLCKLSKDNGSGHTLSEPANLAEERQLQVCHLLQLQVSHLLQFWRQAASAKGPLDLAAR